MKKLNFVGRKIAYWRNKKEWSQEKLATQLQLADWPLSSYVVEKIESGKRRVSEMDLLYLTMILEVQFLDLFSESRIAETKAGCERLRHLTRR